MASGSMSSSSTGKPGKREWRKFLSSPGLIFLIIVTQVPFVVAIYFSFNGWNLTRPASRGFLGWDRMWRNYSRILQNQDFYTVIWNTVVLTGSVVIITFILGLMLAMLLNRPFPGRSLARTLLISPFLVMPVAAAVLWKNVLLDPTFGFSTLLQRSLGLPVNYLFESAPMATVIAVVAWQWTPFVMLILLAGLQSLPDSTLEAASIDGASGFSLFRFIVLPHLKRFIEIALLLETIFVLNVFGIIDIATAGGPGLATTNLPYQIFLEYTKRFNIGRASAYGIFAIILANIVVVFLLRIISKQQEEVAT